MPIVDEPARMSSTLGKFREGVSRHVFVGGNFFVQHMLNRCRGDLGVWALPEELEAAAVRTIAHLKFKTAQGSIHGGSLAITTQCRPPPSVTGRYA